MVRIKFDKKDFTPKSGVFKPPEFKSQMKPYIDL